MADNNGTSSYTLERAKAQRNPYANDFGPPSIDVTSYPAELQATYRDILLVRCQRCHTASRPLNSQYVEPFGAREEEAKKIAQWKAVHPEWFKEPLVWQIEGAQGGTSGVWERYVKKMMAKPGCNITQAEAKRVWDFLRYDSEHRKIGANAEQWAAHRRKLLEEFKKSHPDRYRELYETN